MRLSLFCVLCAFCLSMAASTCSGSIPSISICLRRLMSRFSPKFSRSSLIWKNNNNKLVPKHSTSMRANNKIHNNKNVQGYNLGQNQNILRWPIHPEILNIDLPSIAEIRKNCWTQKKNEKKRRWSRKKEADLSLPLCHEHLSDVTGHVLVVDVQLNQFLTNLTLNGL